MQAFLNKRAVSSVFFAVSFRLLFCAFQWWVEVGTMRILFSPLVLAHSTVPGRCWVPSKYSDKLHFQYEILNKEIHVFKKYISLSWINNSPKKRAIYLVVSRFWHLLSITDFVPSSKEVCLLSKHLQSRRSGEGSASPHWHRCSQLPVALFLGSHFPWYANLLAHRTAYSSKAFQEKDVALGEWGKPI